MEKIMTMSCPACQKEISDSATRCPYCTSEIVTVTGIGKKSISAGLYGLVVGGIFGAIGGAIFSNNWILWAVIVALPCAWLCYTFGLNKKVAK